jgi:hypothetical protein
MIASLRQQYNEAFTNAKYEAYIAALENIYPGQLDFRVAETPIFIPKDFTTKMLDACEAIIDTITTPDYLEQSQHSLPPQLAGTNSNTYPHCIAFDFGICSAGNGEPEPQLIEMQGFPSLFCWQEYLPENHRSFFNWPAGFQPYLNGFNSDSYQDLLKEVILNNEDPAHVILLEIFPEQQKTRVDFHATETMLGIKTVCLTRLIKEGKELYYILDGRKTRIKRIYNRVIVDDLQQQPEEVQLSGKIFEEDLDVEWIPHPSWFFRISKYTLPFIDHPYVPETKFLSELKTIPTDLENYVVKPLFSFAGQGVIIDVTQKDLDEIKDPCNWIIQKKVNYAAIIKTPGEMAKAEIRIFYFWRPGQSRPVAANNLARLSKGKMVGVRYNKDKDWVGGTFCLFEQ